MTPSFHTEIGVRVYERRRPRRDGPQGYRVGISSAGSLALTQSLPPELFDLFVARCASHLLSF
jgi:hypothetical protein